ncbi:hypothetical protein MY4824_008923 [Beauveria thailandica]
MGFLITRAFAHSSVKETCQLGDSYSRNAGLFNRSNCLRDEQPLLTFGVY